MYESKDAAGELSVKLSIELTELIGSCKDKPTPDLLEKIELKEQLLKELREFLLKKNKDIDIPK